MSNYNKVVLVGRLVGDPIVKYLPSDTAVTNFTIAINEVYYKNEEKVEDTTFVDCQVFGKRAENMSKYAGKGDVLLVDGRLKKDSWEDKEGGKRSKMYVKVDECKKIGGVKKETTDNTKQDAPKGKTTSAKGQTKKDDDIPF